MIIQEIRDLISQYNEDAIVFDNPAFDASIIGMTTDGCVLYDLEKMTRELAHDDNISYMDALEFIDYNTIRAISYAPGDQKPIIVDSGFADELSGIEAPEIKYEDIQAENHGSTDIN